MLFQRSTQINSFLLAVVLQCRTLLICFLVAVVLHGCTLGTFTTTLPHCHNPRDQAAHQKRARPQFSTSHATFNAISKQVPESRASCCQLSCNVVFITSSCEPSPQQSHLATHQKQRKATHVPAMMQNAQHCPKVPSSRLLTFVWEWSPPKQDHTQAYTLILSHTHTNYTTSPQIACPIYCTPVPHSCIVFLGASVYSSPLLLFDDL